MIEADDNQSIRSNSDDEFCVKVETRPRYKSKHI